MFSTLKGVKMPALVMSWKNSGTYYWTPTEYG